MLRSSCSSHNRLGFVPERSLQPLTAGGADQLIFLSRSEETLVVPRRQSPSRPTRNQFQHTSQTAWYEATDNAMAY